jgi:hypothetical protein
METPVPVNLSELSGILAKSRQIMSKVETEKPVKESRGSVMAESYDSGYDEKDEREPIYENYETQQNSFDPTNVQDYTEEQVMNSKLPANVKEAMLKNRIPRLSAPPSKFTAEDISRITGAPIKKPTQPKPMVNENIQKPQQNSEMVTISKTELKEMINEGINTFFKQVYDKTITEETIKKTINLLIREGKIATKKK